MERAGSIIAVGWTRFWAWPRWAQVTSVLVLAVVVIASSSGGEERVATVEAVVATTVVDDDPVATAQERTTTTSTTTTTTVLGSPEGATRTGSAELAGDDRATDELDRTAVAASDRAVLDSLVVSPESARSGYERVLFRHWDDEDRNGCDTRCEVLSAQRGADGGWFSEWDGATEYDPSEVHVDHVVALAEAWDSGARDWSADRRDEFADDRTNLVAVTAASNLRKSDKDAAEWFPSRSEANCLWARTSIRVKAKWELSLDPTEKDALSNLLATCGAGLPAPAAASPAETATPPPAPAPEPEPTSAGGCPNEQNYTTADGSCVDGHDADGNGDVNCDEVPRSAKPVQVHGDDPHGLDGDGNGVGCQS